MNNYSYASMRDTFDMSAYFVVGPQDCKSRTITGVIEDALRGGATFIQLRAKNTDAKDITSMARDIAQVIENNGKSDSVAFVIDDRVDVVWQARHKGIKVDGVHIGQTDLEPQEARTLLGEDAIVGLSAETESLVKLINELLPAASTTSGPARCTCPPPSRKLPLVATMVPGIRSTRRRSMRSAMRVIFRLWSAVE